MHHSRTPMEDRNHLLGIATSITAIMEALRQAPTVLELDGLLPLFEAIYAADGRNLREGENVMDSQPVDWNELLVDWERRAAEHGIVAYMEDGVYVVEDEEGARFHQVLSVMQTLGGIPRLSRRIFSGSSQLGTEAFVTAVSDVIGKLDWHEDAVTLGEPWTIEQQVDHVLENYAGYFTGYEYLPGGEAEFLKAQLEDLEVPVTMADPNNHWVAYTVDWVKTAEQLQAFRPYTHSNGFYFWDE